MLNRNEIEVKIHEYMEKINLYKYLLKKGHNTPTQLRNAIVDYKIEVENLKKLMEVI